jgi:signal transduction histidine kinase
MDSRSDGPPQRGAPTDIHLAGRDDAERLRLALQAGGIGVFDVELPWQTGWFSDGVLQVLGYGPEWRDAFAAGFQPLVHPDDLVEVQRARRAVLESGQGGFDAEFRCMAAGGRWQWVRAVAHVTERVAEGRSRRLLGTLQDVDARRRAEEALRRSTADLEQAQRLAGVGSWRWCIEGDRVEWSPTLYEVLRMDPEGPAVNVAGLGRILMPESLACLRAAIQAAITTGASYELELQMLRGDGTLGWAVARGEARFDSAGRVAGLAGTLQDITERKRYEIALREARDQVRRLSGHLEDELDRERKRIAMDVHDELGQRLTAMRMRLDWLQASVAGADTQAIDSVRALIDETIEVTRNVALNLRPPALDVGLVAALEWLAEDFTLRLETAICIVDAPAGDIRLEDRHALALFRIAQESLTNVARHAEATTVRIRLALVGPWLQLEVRDDGRGFDVEAARAQGHFGLLGLRERALRLGAVLDIDSRPGEGTAVRLTMPYPPTAPR